MSLPEFDSLPSILGPLIEGVGEAVGMHVTVLIEGPEPKMQRQLNTIRYVGAICCLSKAFNSRYVYSMHYSFDKQAVPKVWGQANKASFKLVTNAFTSFLETCYCRYSEVLGDYVTDTVFCSTRGATGARYSKRFPRFPTNKFTIRFLSNTLHFCPTAQQIEGLGVGVKHARWRET